MPVFYQPESSLYCVRAVYKPVDAANLAAGLNVFNTANRNGVNGPAMGSAAGGGGFNSLLALPAGGAGPTAASKLKVGPAFLRAFG